MNRREFENIYVHLDNISTFGIHFQSFKPHFHVEIFFNRYTPREDVVVSEFGTLCLHTVLKICKSRKKNFQQIEINYYRDYG